MRSDVASSRTTLPTLIFTFIVFAIAFLVLAAVVGRGLSEYDEGIVVEGATRLMSGGVPHRDFYANYGPGQFAAVAAFFKIFGVSVLSERAWDTLVRSCIVTISFLILRRIASVWLAGLLAAVVLIWLAKVGFYGYPVFPCLLFSLAAVYVAVPTQTIARLVGSGVLVGSATLFRYDAGFYLAAMMTVFVVTRHLVSRRREFREIIGAVAGLWAGIGLVCLPYAAFLLVSGALPDFYLQVIRYPATLYAGMRNLPFPDHYVLAADPTEWSVYLPPILAVLCGLILLIDVVSAREARATARWTIYGLALLSLSFYPKGVTRPSAIQMILSFVPSILTVFASGAVLRRRFGAAALSKAAVALVAFLFVTWPTLDATRKVGEQIASNLKWLTARGTWTDAGAPASCVPPSVLRRVRCFTVPEAWGRVVEYVDAHSSPSDTIFVGLSRHDRIVVNDIILYFAVDREPATRWYHFDPGLQTTEPIQKEIVAALRAKKTPMVVLTNEWENWREPNKSAVSSGVTVLDDYIAQTFHVVDREGSYSILTR